MLYVANMAVRPVQVSIDTELLERIDADPEVQEKGRSAFVRSALRLYLRVKQRREADARIEAAYSDQAAAMQAEVEELSGGQEWPDK